MFASSWSARGRRGGSELKLGRQARPLSVDPSDRAQTRLRVYARPAQDRIARAILSELSQWGRHGTSAKVVARSIRAPLRTVQHHLRRLAEIGEVTQPFRGQWANSSTYHDLTADSLAHIGFQNLRVRVANLREVPPPPCRIARRWSIVPGGDGGDFEKVELAWEGRRVSLRFYPSTGTYEVVVAALVPIPLERAAELYGWLSNELGLGRGETAEVTLIEVNADHRTVRLEPHYLEFRDLHRTAHVLYQKAGALREEYRLASPETDGGRPLPLERPIDLLVEGSPLARYERILRMELEIAHRTQSRSAPELRDPGGVTPASAVSEGYG